MGTDFETFMQRYNNWLDACLEEWNERYLDNRKYHQENCPQKYDTRKLVEFAEDGDAYPHGPGGTGHVRGAVTPWPNSVYYIE